MNVYIYIHYTYILPPHRYGPAATGVPWRSRLSERKSIFVVSDRARRWYGYRKKKKQKSKTQKNQSVYVSTEASGMSENK